MQFGLFVGLLVVHGFLKCVLPSSLMTAGLQFHSSLKTRDLAFLTQGFVFVNIGMTLVIIITLLAVTGRDNMHSANYVFTQTYNSKSACCVQTICVLTHP
jgi:hypothetical protein